MPQMPKLIRWVVTLSLIFVFLGSSQDRNSFTWDSATVEAVIEDPSWFMHYKMEETPGPFYGMLVSYWVGPLGFLANMNSSNRVPGKFGNGLIFDEVNDYVSIGDSSYGPEFTLAFWFNVSDNIGSNFQYIFSHGNAGTVNSINIYICEQSQSACSGKLRTAILDSNDSTSNYAVDVTAPIDGQWHHYAARVKTGEGTKVYLDGVLVGTLATHGGGPINPSGSFRLGARNDLSADRFYGGKLDHIKFYKRALSSTEINQLANETLLNAPVLNTAVSANGQVTLNWSAATGGSIYTPGYHVMYGTTPGVYPTSIDVDSVTNYTVTGLTNGTTYYFAVLAYDESFVSVNSNELSAVPQNPNQSPTVNAGVDSSVSLPNSLNLDGTVSDDGLPNPPGVLTTTWSKQSGPGTVTFGNANSVDTTATFSAPGSYVLRLTANDGSLEVYDELTVTASQATNVSGTISSNTTWDIFGSPYIVTGDITINNGVALTINPGVQVLFDGFYNITANGVLDAQGNASNRIVFSSNQASPAAGNWKHLYLNNAASMLNYVDVLYSDRGAFIPSSATNPQIQNSTFQFNNNGIYMEPPASPNIHNNTITQNVNGVFIGCNVSSGSNPTLVNNSIFNNSDFNIKTFNYGSDAGGRNITAENNWWGENTSLAVEAKIFHKIDDSAFPNVDFTPFLTTAPTAVVDISGNSVTNRFFDPVATETSTINYSLSTASNVSIKIYSYPANTLVRQLVNNQSRASGANTEIWDGKNDSAQIQPDGIYTYTITADASGFARGVYNPIYTGSPAVVVSNISVSPTGTFSPLKGERLSVTYTLNQPAQVQLGYGMSDASGISSRDAGVHTQLWEGRDASGTLIESPYGSGVKIYADPLPLNALVLEHPATTLDIDPLSANPYVIRSIYNEVTQITYGLNESATVTVQIVKPNGVDVVKTLVSNEAKNAGTYTLEWDGRNSTGKTMSEEGNYRIRVTAVNAQGTKIREGSIRILY
jgi:flagellar hook assembly protein FlgD